MKDIVRVLGDMFPMYPESTIEKKNVTLAINEIEKLRSDLQTIKVWYDTDGSVGSLANIIDEIFYNQEKK
jgi:hypothetical protein